MNDDITRKEKIDPMQVGIELESGQHITYKDLIRFWKHQIKILKPIFKIDATVYFVMRNVVPY